LKLEIIKKTERGGGALTPNGKGERQEFKKNAKTKRNHRPLQKVVFNQRKKNEKNSGQTWEDKITPTSVGG